MLTIWGEPLVSAWFWELVNEVHSVVQLCQGRHYFNKVSFKILISYNIEYMKTYGEYINILYLPYLKKMFSYFLYSDLDDKLISNLYELMKGYLMFIHIRTKHSTNYKVFIL